MNEIYQTESILIRVLKIILKTILFLLLLVLFVLIGLFIGYCLIGEGNFWEVLNKETWRHIFEFIR